MIRKSVIKILCRFARKPAAKLYRVVEEWAERETRRMAVSQFGGCGDNITIGKGLNVINPGNVFLGNHVFIGSGAHLLAGNAPIRIGSKVMLAGEVAIITGNHNTGVVGRPMFDVKEKRPFDDMPVVIEDDVWIGFRAVLLKGTKVGRGSVIGAGAVVMGKVPPYSVVAGNPARVLFTRFDRMTINRHESNLKQQRVEEGW